MLALESRKSSAFEAFLGRLRQSQAVVNTPAHTELRVDTLCRRMLILMVLVALLSS
jgi:hypothetical protein